MTIDETFEKKNTNIVHCTDKNKFSQNYNASNKEQEAFVKLTEKYNSLLKQYKDQPEMLDAFKNDFDSFKNNYFLAK